MICDMQITICLRESEFLIASDTVGNENLHDRIAIMNVAASICHRNGKTDPGTGAVSHQSKTDSLIAFCVRIHFQASAMNILRNNGIYSGFVINKCPGDSFRTFGKITRGRNIIQDNAD